jgi:hypothetical protein
MIPNVVGANTRPLFRLLETNDGTKLINSTFHLLRFLDMPQNSIETSSSVKYMGIAYTQQV